MSDSRVLIGRVAVDSGTLMIVDPGYLVGAIAPGHDGEVPAFPTPMAFYEEQIIEAGHQEIAESPFLTARSHWPVNFHCAGDPIAVAFRSGFGDGEYEVYATIGETDWGDRVKRVEVVLIEDPVCPGYVPSGHAQGCERCGQKAEDHRAQGAGEGTADGTTSDS